MTVLETNVLPDLSEVNPSEQVVPRLEASDRLLAMPTKAFVELHYRPFTAAHRSSAIGPAAVPGIDLGSLSHRRFLVQ